jgi:hypothetical protein
MTKKLNNVGPPYPYLEIECLLGGLLFEADFFSFYTLTLTRHSLLFIVMYDGFYGKDGSSQILKLFYIKL